jgi:hypothetical protein
MRHLHCAASGIWHLHCSIYLHCIGISCPHRTAPTRPDEPNRQARSSLPQRTPVRSTGGDRPSGTEMKRVAAARTTGCYRKSVPGTTKHTGCSRTHTHEHQSQWRKAKLGAVLGTKGGPVQRRRRHSTKAGVREWPLAAMTFCLKKAPGGCAPPPPSLRTTGVTHYRGARRGGEARRARRVPQRSPGKGVG